jgi:hypothetical protein
MFKMTSQVEDIEALSRQSLTHIISKYSAKILGNLLIREKLSSLKKLLVIMNEKCFEFPNRYFLFY